MHLLKTRGTTMVLLACPNYPRTDVARLLVDSLQLMGKVCNDLGADGEPNFGSRQASPLMD